MELINVHSSEPDVEDVTLNDVERGYYCFRLVDHSELRPFDVSTSSHLENETQLGATGGAKTLHVMGSFLPFPFMELGIL
jgi:hypothetical protein